MKIAELALGKYNKSESSNFSSPRAKNNFSVDSKGQGNPPGTMFEN
jgi:hypothetical protein